MPENEDDEASGELSPSKVRTAIDRIEQKKLAIQLIESQRYIVKSRTGVPICEDQVEMIDDVVEQLGAAAEAVWPGDDMPAVAEIAEGEWVEEVTEDESDAESEAEDGEE
ncbi:hypothetical protein [Halosimplex halobium]|uniref:hypothetical protein n=1 Tax=Halosimplex halobium TaxID=3396618 RepID=UPI003F574CF4